MTARRGSTRLDFCCYCLLVLVRNASWFSWLEEGSPAANRRCQSPAEGCPCAFGSQGSTGGCKEKRMRPQAEAEALKLQAGPEDPDRVGMEKPK